MGKRAVSSLLVILMLGFGIFFGIELATRGMAHIQGGSPELKLHEQPASESGSKDQGRKLPPAPTKTPLSEYSAQQSEDSDSGKSSAVRPERPALSKDSGVNRFGNQIGDLLQTAAHGTMRTIVSVLDSFVN